MLPICLLYCMLSQFVIALDMSTDVTESGAVTDGPLLLPVCFLLDIMLVLCGCVQMSLWRGKESQSSELVKARGGAHDEAALSQVSMTASLPERRYLKDDHGKLRRF